MKIGLDMMGGDYAPQSTVLGAILALSHLNSDEQLVLIGNKNQLIPLIEEQGYPASKFDIIHSDDVIEMGEHPTKAISQKPNSSISIGFQLLKEGSIDSFSSAGNTGAMFVGALFSVKAIEGIQRPALATLVPKMKGGYGVLLDVGANADCKPEVLVQFGVLGKLYAETVCLISNPKVALMNLGEEREKGNLLTQATYNLMEQSSLLNFVGNVEGRDVFNESADVIVCDGFTGNVILKMAESFYVLTTKKGIKDEFFSRFNYEEYGGSPILGINAPVLIGHGISSPEAIKNMILRSRDMVKTQLTQKIKSIFSQ